MATKIKLEFIDKGFQEIINSPGVAALTQSAAQSIAARAGDGFEWSTYKTRGLRYDRTAAVVKAANYKARRAEATDKALSKAVQSCRL